MVRTRSAQVVVEIAGSQERNGGDQNSTPSPADDGKNDGSADYGKLREERMRENLQRLQTLGIIDLALKLKSERRSYKRVSRGTPEGKYRRTGSITPRRSSRLQNVTPVTYVEISKVDEKPSRKRSVLIEEGSKEEVYSEEHEKLLGTCDTSWDLFVDGYGGDGRRIYDPVEGKTCHQCRQKTLGHRTKCSKCNIVQGQFCGDCLYMRYGENVLEAKKNPNWVCPVCRGICNCSLCRTKKGWAPTGALHRKVKDLGYKSVAHYLIQTRRVQTDSQSPDSANVVSAKRSLPFTKTEDSYQTNLDGGPNNNNDSNEKKELESLNQHNDSRIELENNSNIKTKRKNTKIPTPIVKTSTDSIAGRLRRRQCRDKESVGVENSSLLNNFLYTEKCSVGEKLHSSDDLYIASNDELGNTEKIVDKEDASGPKSYLGGESGSKLELGGYKESEFDEGKCRVLAESCIL